MAKKEKVIKELPSEDNIDTFEVNSSETANDALEVSRLRAGSKKEDAVFEEICTTIRRLQVLICQLSDNQIRETAINQAKLSISAVE